MNFVVREIRSDFMDNISTIKEEIMKNNKQMNGIQAFLWATKQIDKRTSPYTEFINDLEANMSTTLLNASNLEKDKQIEGAIYLYEKLANEGYTSPPPHERLRIIYTKQFEFEKAIFTCKRYISILNELNKFNPGFSNIHLIPTLEKNIAKLELRLKPKGA